MWTRHYLNFIKHFAGRPSAVQHRIRLWAFAFKFDGSQEPNICEHYLPKQKMYIEENEENAAGAEVRPNNKTMYVSSSYKSLKR